MSSTATDLVALLELPSAQFLPEAFLFLTGREPDAIGLLHYASRMQRRLPRALVLAEMRDSPEGRAHAARSACADLDLLHTRYLQVRNLPLQKLRWKLLPGVGARIPDDSGFQWERWANDYIAQKLAREAERALQTIVPSASPPCGHSELVGLQFEQMQSRLREVSTALQTVVTTLQSKGVPATDVQTLRNAAASLQAAPPDVSAVPWEARQALYYFAQAMRS